MAGFTLLRFMTRGWENTLCAEVEHTLQHPSQGRLIRH